MARPLLLFVIDGNIGRNRHSEPTEASSVSQILGSCRHADLTDVEAIFWDRYYYAQGKPATEHILDQCQRMKPAAVILSYWDCGELLNVWEVMSEVRKLHIPLVHVWYDMAAGANTLAEPRLPFTDLNLVLDLPAALSHQHQTSQPEKFLYLWPVVDNSLFYPGPLERKIDVSFCGHLHPTVPQRRRYVERIQQLPIRSCFHYGLYDLAQPTPLTEVADVYRNSRIVVSVTDVPGWGAQLKGRTFEALHSGAMLLETANSYTGALFTPGEDYVMFQEQEDLVRQIHYYLEHDEKRQAIANQGVQKAQQFTDKVFWSKVLEKL